MKKLPQHSNSLRRLFALTLAGSTVDIRTWFWLQGKWGIGCTLLWYTRLWYTRLWYTRLWYTSVYNILVRTQYDMCGDVQQLLGRRTHMANAIEELIRKHTRSAKA